MINNLTLSIVSLGSSGRSSFNPRDICGERAVFVIARNQDGEAVGCGAIRPMDENTAEVKRMYAKEKRLSSGQKSVYWKLELEWDTHSS